MSKSKKRERHEGEEEEEEGERTPTGQVTASIRVFPVPKKAQCADEEEYKQRLASREVMVTREKARILSGITVSRDERADKLLKWECQINGLSDEGIRAILLQRLAGHDAGEKVMLAAHLNQAKAARIDPEEARKDSLLQKPTVLLRMGNGRGEEGFLAVPHDVIRNAILPRVHLFALVCLARTCKYILPDVTAELWKRSRAIFGEKGGTPKAIGALMSLCTSYVSVPVGRPQKMLAYWQRWWGQNSWDRRTLCRAACESLGTRDNHEWSTIRDDWLINNAKKSFPDLKLNLVYDHYCQAIQVARCIEKYGTVDAYVTKARLQREKATLKGIEQETLLKFEAERVAAVNKFIGFDLFLPGKDEGLSQVSHYYVGAGRSELLNLTELGKFVYSLIAVKSAYVKAHKKITKHVYTGAPKTVAGAAADTKSMIGTSESIMLAAVMDTGKLTDRTRPYFEWVMMHLGTYASWKRGQMTEKMAASLCKIALDPQGSGLDRLQHAERHLAIDAEPMHCVLLLVDTREFCEFRIVHVPQKVETFNVSHSRSPVTAYTLSCVSIADALPESDKKLKRALDHDTPFSLPPSGPLSGKEWERHQNIIYMDVNRATVDYGKPMSTCGNFYRSTWLPFVPILVSASMPIMSMLE